jgi:hypothetical protein
MVLFVEQIKNRNMTLNEWIVFGRVGTSSKTMWAVVTGTLNAENIKKFRVEIPYDRDDFSRCYTLWKECKLTDADLQKIKEICPIWKPFIDNWHELVRRYESNEQMYEYISKLVEQIKTSLDESQPSCLGGVSFSIFDKVYMDSPFGIYTGEIKSINENKMTIESYSPTGRGSMLAEYDIEGTEWKKY